MNKVSVVAITGLIVIILLSISCQSIKQPFSSASPYERYQQALLDSELADKPMVQAWIQAGDSSLNKPVKASLPQKTTVTYFKDEPTAFTWKLDMAEGRNLNVKISQTDTTQQVFLDLFAIQDEGFSRKTSSDDSLLKYESSQDETIIIRLQPELLVSGSATLSITDEPSMGFPVSNATIEDIKSFWGAPRDGGARKHEGVDIFADRGTPAIAAAEGRITRTGTSNLGGKVVWLRAKGRSLYYAHLDSIIAQSMQKVQAGDTLGLVGNTGNARTTPPHLHFGIYGGQAINPLPFIDAPRTDPPDLNTDPALLGKWARVNNPKANIRPLPSTEEPPITSLKQNEAVRVIGATGEWYKILLPDHQKGFVHGTLLESVNDPLETLSLAAGRSLYDSISSSSNPVATLQTSEELFSHASYNNQPLVKYKDRFLWLKSNDQL